MKIVVLDAATLGADLDLSPLESLGEVKVWDATPPEMVADIGHSGITLTGGGSRLRGLPEALEEHAHMPVMLADDGEDCIIAGMSQALGRLDEMQDGPLNLMRRKQLT